MELLKKIAGIPLFSGLSRKQCAGIAAITLERNFKKGQHIFAEGDEGHGFYAIISGGVKIFKLSPEGKEQILHIMGPGEPFGEAAVFAGEPFPASAQTIAESKILFFPRKSFSELLSQNPSLALNMLSFLSHRLRVLTNLVETLSLKEVPGRLAAYLLYSGKHKNEPAVLELGISKNQLAGLLGTIPETISRILSRMRKEKLITVNGRYIQALDIKGLEELASGARRLA
ncbi:MAG TPA: Crp/Fnr family transcriptional regulator [Smithellaceae bacterium]|nr:Crp/Fnr family transcriptional regulator [Smithellaceae bacterium]